MPESMMPPGEHLDTGEPTVEELQQKIRETEQIDADILREAISQIAEGAHIHKWFIIDVWKPPSQAPHPRITKWAETVALCRCLECGLPETFSLDGSWTLAQLRLQQEEAKND